MITTPLDQTANPVTVDFSMGTVQIQTWFPPEPQYGNEGQNYTQNVVILPLLPSSLQQNLAARPEFNSGFQPRLF